MQNLIANEGSFAKNLLEWIRNPKVEILSLHARFDEARRHLYFLVVLELFIKLDDGSSLGSL